MSKSIMQKAVSSLMIFVVASLCQSCEAQVDRARTNAANDALRSSLGVGSPDLYYIKQYLANGDYEPLEALFRDGLEQCKTDISYESYVQKGFELFKPANAIDPVAVDFWVERTGSAIAYTARGVLKAHQGFAARGGGWSKDTPEGNFALMHRLHSEAMQDLAQAISLNPDILPAYECAIQIAKAAGQLQVAREILDSAVSHDNRTYYVRFQYMIALQPRWCGSYSMMRSFADECAALADINPRLWSLQGEVIADQADMYWNQKDYHRAMSLYSKALEFGDRSSWLRNRAGCKYYLKDYEGAIADLNLALTLAPSDQTAQKWLGLSKAELARN